MNNYYIGTRVKCQMTFYSDEAKTTVGDPTGVTFRIKAPKGTITEYIYGTDSELVKDSTGVYHVNWDTDGSTDGVGEYSYTFKGTGAIVESQEAKFMTVKTIFLD